MSKVSTAVVLTLSLFTTTSSIAAFDCEKANAVDSGGTPCNGDVVACNAWRQFRAAHPVPYQTIVVDFNESGEGVVIVSEPPPVAQTPDVVQLIKAAFSGNTVTLERFPVGWDGWLLDAVVHVKGFQGPTVLVPAAQGGSLRLPAEVADRLRFISAALFDTEHAFYVDELNRKSPAPQPLHALDFAAADAAKVAALGKWRPLDATTVTTKTWDQLLQSKKSTAFIDTASESVAMAIPAKSDPEEMRGVFREFAVTTDYLVGAFVRSEGGVVLLGRNRVEPLDVLPPMRHETLVSLASALGEPLGQSYERQRVLAGKVLKGDYAGWDWAPAYLSSQLQDTEFGQLLNIADQQVKSFSEHAAIRYARFAYPIPATFPFGDKAASEYLGASELIFNWNTEGFGSAQKVSGGTMLGISNTGALPVSYILPEASDSADARSASERGSKHFADSGDAVLARVARNVFLFQALNASKPFKSRGPDSVPNRSDKVTKVLTDESLRWLSATVGPGEDHSEGIADAVRQSKVSIETLAGLMAQPDANRREIVALVAKLRIQRGRVEDALQDVSSQIVAVEQAADAGEAAFRHWCREHGGDITPMFDGRLRCHYTTSDSDLGGAPDFAAPYRAAKHQLEVLRGRAAQEESAYREFVNAVDKRVELMRQAERVAELLRPLPAYTRDLSGVLTRVLDAAATVKTENSIRTPSVVMSCNARNVVSVGGHNIGATSSALVGLGRGPGSFGGRVRALPIPARPQPRSPTSALGIKDPSSGSFLSALRAQSLEGPTGTSAGALDRARLCNCDIYVERGQGMSATVVAVGPPPSSRSVFGINMVASTLAKAKPGRVLFAGFNEQTVSTLSLSAAQQAKQTGKTKGFVSAIETGRLLFQRAEARVGALLRLKARNGKVAFVTAGETRTTMTELQALLATRPEWNGMTVRTASTRDRLVSVSFQNRGVPESISVEVFGQDGKVTSSQELSTVATAALQDAASNGRSVQEVVERLGERLTRESSVKEVRFFLNDVGQISRHVPERISLQTVLVLAD
jgi:hypothetical protein